MTPSDFHGSWDRFKPLIGYSASSLREGIPMLTWAVPPISCYKTVVVGVVSQLVEVKTPWFYRCTMLYPSITPTAPCSLLLLPFVSVTLTFQFFSDVICNAPSSTRYGCSPEWVGYVYYNILHTYIYIYIYIHIYTYINIYMYPSFCWLHTPYFWILVSDLVSEPFSLLLLPQLDDSFAR